MIINDLDGYYIVFDTKNGNTELDTLVKSPLKNSVKSLPIPLVFPPPAPPPFPALLPAIHIF